MSGRSPRPDRAGPAGAGRLNAERVAVAVLNWNGWPDTLACLASLERQKGARPAMVIVCDNGSTDDSLPRIAEFAGDRYAGRNARLDVSPEEAVSALDPARRRAAAGGALGGPDAEPPYFLQISNRANRGFAAGLNPAIRAALAAGCDFVWLLNNDAYAHPAALRRLLAQARAEPGAGIIGSTVVYQGRRGEVQCAGGCRYHPVSTVFRPCLGGLTLRQAVTSGEAPRLDYVHGASLFVRSDVFRQVGLLNEDFFLFYEELDLCRRARALGFDLAWARRSVVFHQGSASLPRAERASDARSLTQYHENLSTLLYTARHHPRLLPAALLCRFLGKLACLGARRDWRNIRPLLRAYADFFRRGRRGRVR